MVDHQRVRPILLGEDRSPEQVLDRDGRPVPYVLSPSAVAVPTNVRVETEQRLGAGDNKLRPRDHGGSSRVRPILLSEDRSPEQVLDRDGRPVPYVQQENGDAL